MSCVRPESRLSREGYYEGTPAPQALDVDVAASREDEPFVAAFELQTEVPTVLNEVRIRAVEWVLRLRSSMQRWRSRLWQAPFSPAVYSDLQHRWKYFCAAHRHSRRNSDRHGGEGARPTERAAASAGAR